MLMILIATIIVLAIVLNFINRYTNLFADDRLKFWIKHNITGPKPIAFYGNLFPTFYRPFNQLSIEWYKKYGTIFGIYRFYGPELVISDPIHIRQVLVTESTDVRFKPNRLDDRNAENVYNINPRRDEWHEMRRSLTPMFTTRQLKRWTTSALKPCVDRFSRHLTDKSLYNGNKIALSDCVKDLILDIILVAVFGVDDTDMAVDGHRRAEIVRHINCLTHMSWLMFVVSNALPPPIVNLWTRLTKWLGVQNEPHDEVFAAFIRNIIKKRRNRISNANTANASPANRSDRFIDILIEFSAQSEQHDKSSGTYRANLKQNTDTIDDQIVDLCLVLLFAGYHTVSTKLTLIIYELALNPQIQDNLRDEINEHFVNTNGTDEVENINYETVKKLPFLDACVCEGLRKYPAFLLQREVMDDIVLEGTDTLVPRGTVVNVPTYALHYDSKYFDDPEVYRPDRFIGTNRDTIQPYTYLPFGDGPRNCIGKRLALLELKVILAETIRRFRFYRLPETPVPVKFKPHFEHYVYDDIPIVFKSKQHFEYVINELSQKYGPVFTVFFGHKPHIFVTDLDVARKTLKKVEFSGRPKSYIGNHLSNDSYTDITFGNYSPTLETLRQLAHTTLQ
ncbi:cytochrome P450 3A13-like [Oppia nitens]|uniref:cytochrome P450 3A13-like n=1 Tax=Oppia nitens TaxID=1686743 RepID=UPI0023DC6A9E|nr:cytochrome P450 3A13-like [Oppia nitens]